jgi:hypothetical protein
MTKWMEELALQLGFPDGLPVYLFVRAKGLHDAGCSVWYADRHIRAYLGEAK